MTDSRSRNHGSHNLGWISCQAFSLTIRSVALFGLLMTAMPIARAQVQLFPSLQGGTQNQPNSQNPDQPSANPEPTAPSGMAVETLGAVDTEAVGAVAALAVIPH